MGLEIIEFKPFIAALAGPPLSGKTTLGLALAERTNLHFLDIDEKGKEIESLLEPLSGPLANTGRMMAKYGYLFSLAANELTKHRPVLLAATFSHNSYVDYLGALADLHRRLNQSPESALRFFVLDAPVESLGSRVSERVERGSNSDILTLDRAIDLRERFIPIVGNDAVPVNTGLSIEENVNQILAYLEPFKIKMTIDNKEAILPFSILIEEPIQPEDTDGASSVGVDALILTGNQYLLLGQRNTPRAGKIRGLHLPGGHMESGEEIMETLAREIKEEVGLEENEWEPKSILGVTQSKETLASDIIYLCHTPLSSHEILSRRTDGEIGIKFIQNNPQDIKMTMLTFLRTASTPSIAALYLYGKQNFGLEWAQIILDRIARRNAVYNLFTDQQREVHMRKLAARLSKMNPSPL